MIDQLLKFIRSSSKGHKKVDAVSGANYLASMMLKVFEKLNLYVGFH